MKRARPVTVFTAGCFNRIHQAHLRLLKAARSLGDRLVVVLANDAHNHKANAVPAKIRLERLRKLGLADEVVIGAAASFADSLRKTRPDILVLGYDQRLPDAETAALVKKMGIETVVLPWFPGKEKGLSPDA